MKRLMLLLALGIAACEREASESAAVPTATHMNKTRKPFIVVSPLNASSVTTAMHE